MATSNRKAVEKEVSMAARELQAAKRESGMVNRVMRWQDSVMWYLNEDRS